MHRRWWIPFSLCLLVACPKAPLGELEPLQRAQQLVLVTTGEWDAQRGSLARYERKATAASWKPVGASVPVTVGRGGLAWGRGLHTGRVRLGPVKVEADGRSPAGAFRLRAAFGHAEQRDQAFPYMALTEFVVCVNDIESRRYNRIVHLEHVVDPDWQSAAPMRAEDGRHALGVVIDHNVGEHFVPGSGSCCFLRIGDVPTETSTAMSEEVRKTLVEWLDPAALPVLVQLPLSERRRLGGAWDLPR